MDRVSAGTRWERARLESGTGGDFVLPSRAEAISGLASALDARGGPVLLTGEAGVGKTWVCRRLKAVMPADWLWTCIDLSPAVDPSDCLRLILHSLGHHEVSGLADARSALQEILAESAEGGRPCGLIVEEAHHASPGVMEELRVLGNRVDGPEHFAGMILVGQNPLARRMATRPFAAFQARLSSRVHLRPLDVEELRAWVSRLGHDRPWSESRVEHLHRETSGNPRKVLAVASRRTHSEAKAIAPVREPEPAPGPLPVKPNQLAGPTRIPECEAPPVAPGRPPLRFGEGMIEVGWEPTAEAAREADPEVEPLTESLTATASGTGPTGPSNDRLATVEVIDDHYAALQAWTEWAQNQGREPVPGTPTPGDLPSAFAANFTGRLDPETDTTERLSGLAGVRAEGQHDFAPYSQLFSKLRQARDSH